MPDFVQGWDSEHTDALADNLVSLTECWPCEGKNNHSKSDDEENSGLHWGYEDQSTHNKGYCKRQYTVAQYTHTLEKWSENNKK